MATEDNELIKYTKSKIVNFTLFRICVIIYNILMIYICYKFIYSYINKIRDLYLLIIFLPLILYAVSLFIDIFLNIASLFIYISDFDNKNLTNNSPPSPVKEEANLKYLDISGEEILTVIIEYISEKIINFIKNTLNNLYSYLNNLSENGSFEKNTNIFINKLKNEDDINIKKNPRHRDKIVDGFPGNFQKYLIQFFLGITKIAFDIFILYHIISFCIIKYKIIFDSGFNFYFLLKSIFFSIIIATLFTMSIDLICNLMNTIQLLLCKTNNKKNNHEEKIKSYEVEEEIKLCSSGLKQVENTIYPAILEFLYDNTSKFCIHLNEKYISPVLSKIINFALYFKSLEVFKENIERDWPIFKEYIITTFFKIKEYTKDKSHSIYEKTKNTIILIIDNICNFILKTCLLRLINEIFDINQIRNKNEKDTGFFERKILKLHNYCEAFNNEEKKDLSNNTGQIPAL